MKIPEHLTLAVDRWFSENTGLGGCSDKDVAELASIFYEVAFNGGRESVDDALAVVESFGPGIAGLNDTYARQILLAQEVHRLRAVPPAPAAPSGAIAEAEPAGDSGRLDWLVRDVMRGADIAVAILHDEDGFPVEFNKARAAIDAYRSATQAAHLPGVEDYQQRNPTPLPGT